MKNITQLPLASQLELTDQIYLVTANGTVDSRALLSTLQAAMIDRGGIYDPVASQPVGADSASGEPILAQSSESVNARTFTLDPATGLFTFGPGSIGSVFRMDFQLASPKGSISNQDMAAQFSYNRGGAGAYTRLIDVSFVGNQATHLSVGGFYLFAPIAEGDTCAIELFSATTTLAPVSAMVALERAV